MPDAPLRFLVPFTDDSTLFFAARMAGILKSAGHEVKVGRLVSDSELSYRQLQSILPDGPDILLKALAFKAPENFAQFDAIVSSRMFAPLRDMMRDPAVRHRADRPCVISFQGGLDFDPERGFFNRRFADSVFVTPKRDVQRYKDWAETAETNLQYVGFGHPAFIQPKRTPQRQQGDIFFFAQAISPRTRAARIHILEVLGSIARANPDRTVWIKLRHLPKENQNHLHREEHPYPMLLEAAGVQNIDNLKLTADAMDEVLPRAAIGITCTSTAAIDLVREDVPTMIYLDYVENYHDSLMPPMRRAFQHSGLITKLDDLLHLRAGRADDSWMQDMFVGADHLVDQIIAAVDFFRKSPVRAKLILPEPETSA